MLTLKLISEETERVIKAWRRNISPEPAKLLKKYWSMTSCAARASRSWTATSSTRNQLSKQIGGLMKEGKKDEAEKVKQRWLSSRLPTRHCRRSWTRAQADMTNELLQIPNIPNDLVPEGKDANDNVVVKEGGPMPNLGDDALCHWDLLKKYHL